MSSHACAAFVNYAEDCDTEVLNPYLDTFMQKLGVRLSSNIRTVKEQAITAVAVLAGVTEYKFRDYYSHVIPILKATIASVSLHLTEVLGVKIVLENK